MHINFTEEELQYIDTSVFGWKIDKDCPAKVRKSINGKMKTIKSYEQMLKSGELWQKTE